MDKGSSKLLQASQLYVPDVEFLEFVGATTVASSSDTALLTPSDVQIGDIIVLVNPCSISGLSAPNIPTPTGFTLVSTITDGSSYLSTYYTARLSTFFKVATEAGQQSITVRPSGNHIGARCCVFRPAGVSYSSLVHGGAQALTVGHPLFETGSSTVSSNSSSISNPVACIAFAELATGVPTITGDLVVQSSGWYLNTRSSGGFAASIGGGYRNLSIFYLELVP